MPFFILDIEFEMAHIQFWEDCWVVIYYQLVFFLLYSTFLMITVLWFQLFGLLETSGFIFHCIADIRAANVSCAELLALFKRVFIPKRGDDYQLSGTNSRCELQ